MEVCDALPSLIMLRCMGPLLARRVT